MAAQPETLRNIAVSSALSVALGAAHQLAELGIEVFAACVTAPHMPTLFVSSLPPGVDYGIKAKYPNSHGGVTFIHAAVWEGVRLEWMHDMPGVKEVGHV